ncbi:MAG: hypothetical protein AAGA54_20355 [Myxococcota bacterium]
MQRTAYVPLLASLALPACIITTNSGESDTDPSASSSSAGSSDDETDANTDAGAETDADTPVGSSSSSGSGSSSSGGMAADSSSGGEDCPEDGVCEFACGGFDPDCESCGADEVCVTGCAAIDPDCQCADDTCPGACFEDVCFIQGEISYADEVLAYDNTLGGSSPTESTDPAEALDAPDFEGSDGYVSLGRGGVLELAFVDNVLTNSGDAAADLFVFEIGPDVEASFIQVRGTPATLELLKSSAEGGWLDVGQIEGSTRQIDIDEPFPGFAPGTLVFDAVRIRDDPDQGDSSGSTVGADIDAVGAIATLSVQR